MRGARVSHLFPGRSENQPEDTIKGICNVINQRFRNIGELTVISKTDIYFPERFIAAIIKAVIQRSIHCFSIIGRQSPKDPI